MGDWDEITRDLTTGQGESVVIRRERLDAACRVLQALLCGRDDGVPAIEGAAANDAFGDLETMLLALYRELRRRTPARCEGTS